MLRYILVLALFLFMSKLSYADDKKIKAKTLKEELREIINNTKSNKEIKDEFLQCWFDNVKPNSTESHTKVVAIYCSNKTGYKLP